jgi:tetratricopeptide (TPR) repeat protein
LHRGFCFRATWFPLKVAKRPEQNCPGVRDVERRLDDEDVATVSHRPSSLGRQTQNLRGPQIADTVLTDHWSVFAMAAKKVAVTNIGTCRIAEPLAAAGRNKLIKRANESIYGFIHTSKEALQQIAYRDGGSLPKNLAPYLCSRGAFPARKSEGPSDLYFVEISSVKEIHFDGVLLQINYLDNAFASRPNLLQTFFRLHRSTDRPAREAELEQLPEFRQVTPLEARILREGYVHLTQYDELRADMAEITARLPAPVVFVNHINVVSNTGQLIQSRNKLCGWLRKIADEDRYTLFDPTPEVLAYGREKALENGGQDMNHYTSEFKEHYGSLLIDKFCVTKTLRQRATSAVLSAASRAFSSVRPAEPQGTIMAAQPPSAPVETATAPEAPVAAKAPETATAAKVTASTLTTAIAEAMKADRLADALRLTDELIALGVQSYKSMTVVAKVMVKHRRFEDAVGWWQKAVDVAPDPSVPLYELTRCYTKLNDQAQIVATIDRLFEIDDESVSLLTTKRNALVKLGDYAAVAAVALSLVKLDVAAAYAMAPTLVNHGELNGAASLVAACRAEGLEAASDPAFQLKLVKNLEKAGKAALDNDALLTAAAIWRSILLIEPDHAHAISRLGRLVAKETATAKKCLEASDIDGAIAAYVLALEYNPNDVKALRSLARCYDQREMAAESADAWERLGNLEPDSDMLFRRAARFAARSGDVTRALTLYGRLDPTEIPDDVQTTIGSLVRKAAKTMRTQFDGNDLQNACQNAAAILGVDPFHADALRVLRTAHANLSRQSTTERPSPARQLAWRMIGEIHAHLREAERRAEKYPPQQETSDHAA